MNKTALIVLVGILLLLGDSVLATPPDSIKVSFDTTGIGLMTVQIFHQVKNPATHFIYQVAVTLNGKLIIQQTIGKQFSNSEQVLVYELIDAKKGDKIDVTGTCNIMGKKTQEFIAPGAKIKQ